ncbi:hypothetical protein, partial [Planktothrix sp.]|uniref:hypothetical protein n=1 Tax=Planktothrix sp. TaxID=3088171 RepID=UPI0038D435EE
MFVKILKRLNEVAYQINREYPGRQHDHLFEAINIWCKKLDLNENETDYIQRIYCQPEVNELTNYLDEEWNNFPWPLIRSKFYKLKVWEPIKSNNENIKFKVAIAFAIT